MKLTTASSDDEFRFRQVVQNYRDVKRTTQSWNKGAQAGTSATFAGAQGDTSVAFASSLFQGRT